MAKKRKAKRASKSQGITINWGIIGLIVVIALLIGLWQINGKPQSEAASEYWPNVVRSLSADININGTVDASWRANTVAAPYEIVGYRVEMTPYGATSPTSVDLSMSEIGSTTLKGQTEPIYYASVKNTSMVLTTHGTVGVYPIFKHPQYAPNTKEIMSSGMKVSAMLNYKTSY